MEVEEVEGEEEGAEGTKGEYLHFHYVTITRGKIT